MVRKSDTPHIKTPYIYLMKKTICLLLVVAVISACNNRKNEIPAINPEFTNYISGFTSGVISAGSNLMSNNLSGRRSWIKFCSNANLP